MGAVGMGRRRALLAGVALFGAALAALPVPQVDLAEAITQVRSKVAWSSLESLPRNVIEREEYLTRNPDHRSHPLVFMRDNTLSRQSQADAAATPVDIGLQFTDVMLVVPSLDIEDAVIHVHQQSFAARGATPTARDCHVRILRVTDPNGVRVGPAIPQGGATEVKLGLLKGSVPYHVTLISEIPESSQTRVNRRVTPRVLTSVVRIGKRVPDRSRPRPGATATPTPMPRACGGEIGGRGFTNLNTTLVVRTELNRNVWAETNLVPTPTPIAIR